MLLVVHHCLVVTTLSKYVVVFLVLEVQVVEVAVSVRGVVSFKQFISLFSDSLEPNSEYDVILKNSIVPLPHVPIKDSVIRNELLHFVWVEELCPVSLYVRDV